MKKIVLLIIVALTLGVGTYYSRNTIFPGIERETLRIAMNTEATDISPYALNLNNVTRTQNVYEGLVAFDRNLKVIPALAVSWGNVSDTTWEFRLREGVMFHDGSPFSAQDVIDTFSKAKNSSNSQISNYVSTIKDVSIAEGNRIVISTDLPDPLLLSKLTKIFIYHDDNVGTGPYKLDEWIPGERFTLLAFDDYWGETPQYENVRYEVIKNRVEREAGFANGDIDILVGLTPEQALNLPENQVVNSYGLEVNFLMFQMDDPLLKEAKVREAIQSLIDPNQIESIGNHFVKRTGQFVAQGVFGYNPNIPPFYHSTEKEQRDIFGRRLERLDFDYLSSYQTLSEYLVSRLRETGFSVKENALTPNELLTKIQANESQLFLIGWQSEDGDAGSFFEAFIHSKGPFNNGRYKNVEVDQLIEESRTEMDSKKRLALLQEIGAKVQEDFIGIPLFETSRLYGLSDKVQWFPRLDGQVLAADVSMR